MGHTLRGEVGTAMEQPELGSIDRQIDRWIDTQAES